VAAVPCERCVLRGCHFLVREGSRGVRSPPIRGDPAFDRVPRVTYVASRNGDHQPRVQRDARRGRGRGRGDENGNAKRRDAADPRA